MISYQFYVVPKWLIKDYPLYFFDDKKLLRNFNSGKVIKMQLKGYTKGYYLKGKFVSLKQLRPLLVRYKKEKLPF